MTVTQEDGDAFIGWCWKNNITKHEIEWEVGQENKDIWFQDPDAFRVKVNEYCVKVIKLLKRKHGDEWIGFRKYKK